MLRLRIRAGMALAAILLALIGFSTGPAAHAATISGYLTFETGSDAAPVSLPGISFRAAGGAPWVYGDVRTHKYNAPFSADCSDRPGNIASPVCQFSMSENLFAWAGAVNAGGRFDFTDGPASFVDFGLSVGAGTTVLAYNSADKAIAAVYMRPNTGGGDRFVHLEAPAGEAISYVTIQGTAGLWLLDDLATDAPGVPDQRPPDNSRAARISVVQRAASPATLSPGSQITLTVVAANHGRGGASDVTITLPLDPALLRVDDASFSRPAAWVSALGDSALTIRTGGLGAGGDVVTATIRLTLLDTAADGGAIDGRLGFSWRDKAGGGGGASNDLGLRVGGPAFAPSLSASADGAAVTFSSAIFAPREPVGLWYNDADGNAVAVKTVFAGEDGAISVAFDTGGLPAGAYTMVAYGHWTEFTALAPFTVSP